MLSIGQHDRRYGRRDFLKVGGLALGGLSLPGLLAARAAAAGGGVPVTDKSVVFLFMHGGPSQIETFDPKMTAPSEIRSVTGEIQTKVPGVTFGSTLEKIAALSDKVSIVRSFATGDSSHNIKPIVHTDTFDANLGSIYSRIVGTNHPLSGMPTNAALFPQAVAPEAMPAEMGFGNFLSTGSFGSSFAPFVPGSGGQMQENMKLSIPLNRLDDRRLLLTGLDRIQAARDATGTLDGLNKLRQQAFDVILGGVSEAFDLSQEDPATIARYDTSRLVRPEHIDKKWNNHKRYADNGQTLGKLLLLARRLCERGCGFVTVTTNFVWDMHADSNNAGVAEGMRYVGVPFDHAVSAFIEDVEARGLSDKILLVCCGEMGRTPRLDNNGGRNHWGALAPLLLSGGGLKMGHVVGQSTRDAGQPLSEPITNKHLIATILHTLFDVSELRITQGVPSEVARDMASWETIPGLL